MKNMITTPTPARRLLTALAPVAVLAMALTGCSGSSSGIADGDYFGTYACEGSCSRDDDLVHLVVDGDTFTYNRVMCDGDEDGLSVGTLNDDQATVSWTSKGDYESPAPVSTGSDGELITIDRTSFAAEGSDVADASLAAFAERCTTMNGDDWQNPLD